MNENSIKLCRFCMYEEKCGDDTNNVLNVFDSGLIGIPEKIMQSTQLYLTPDDIIPPNICKNCIDNVEKFYSFLETCHKSDVTLQEIFKLKASQNISQMSTNNLSNELTESSSTIPKKLSNYDVIGDANCSKTKDNIDDYVYQSDSNSSSANESKERTVTKKCRENVNCSISDTVLYFNGRKTEVYQINESMRKIIGRNVFECSICFTKFTSFFEYQEHRSSHNGRFVFSSSKCNEVISSRQNLVWHGNKRKVPCKICERKIAQKSLSAPLRTRANKKCNNCVRYIPKLALVKHLKTRRGLQRSICHLCGKKTNCQSCKTRHKARHCNARSYCCEYCNFLAKSKSVLRAHTSRKHKGKKSVCEICAKLFKSESSMKQHKKRIDNPKRYVCAICKKKFTKNCNLKMHVKTHTQQKIHTCRVCGREFFMIKQLKEHMHTHRQSYLSCPKCGRAFFYKKYLEKHILKCMPCPREEHFKAIAWNLKSTISLPSSSLRDLK